MATEVDKAQEDITESKLKATVFDKIISKETKADIIYEDDDCLAFNEIAPQGPTHFLVIPKRRIAALEDAMETDQDLLGKLLLVASRLAKEKLPKGYRLVINNGPQGAQSVWHLHVHVIGGRQMTWPPG